MKVFSYLCVCMLVEVVVVVVIQFDVWFIVGGINLLDLMKLQIEMLVYFVDVNLLEFDCIEFICDGGLCIGVLVCNSDFVVDVMVWCGYLVLLCVLLVGVLGQLCNCVIMVGNLLQCICCFYFYDIDQFCNKCQLGSGCVVQGGVFCFLVVIGISLVCIVIYFSDMVVVMCVLDVEVEIVKLDGQVCCIFIVDFYKLFGDMLQIEYVLGYGELVIVVLLLLLVGGVQVYCKLCDCVFYVFVLVFVVVILQCDGSGCVVFGGMVFKFWCVEVVEVLLWQGVWVFVSQVFVGVVLQVDNVFKFMLVECMLVSVFYFVGVLV